MPVLIIIVCLFAFSFVIFFIAYSEEKRSYKIKVQNKKTLVDDASCLFEEKKEEREDIEII